VTGLQLPTADTDLEKHSRESRALWRPSGQNGPSLHRVINETALKKKPGIETTLTSVYQGAYYEGTRQIQMAQWPMQGLA
jgi:hypothetical protein